MAPARATAPATPSPASTREWSSETAEAQRTQRTRRNTARRKENTREDTRLLLTHRTHRVLAARIHRLTSSVLSASSVSSVLRCSYRWYGGTVGKESVGRMAEK